MSAAISKGPPVLISSPNDQPVDIHGRPLALLQQPSGRRGPSKQPSVVVQSAKALGQAHHGGAQQPNTELIAQFLQQCQQVHAARQVSTQNPLVVQLTSPRALFNPKNSQDHRLSELLLQLRTSGAEFEGWRVDAVQPKGEALSGVPVPHRDFAITLRHATQGPIHIDLRELAPDFRGGYMSTQTMSQLMPLLRGVQPAGLLSHHGVVRTAIAHVLMELDRLETPPANPKVWLRKTLNQFEALQVFNWAADDPRRGAVLSKNLPQLQALESVVAQHRSRQAQASTAQTAQEAPAQLTLKPPSPPAPKTTPRPTPKPPTPAQSPSARKVISSPVSPSQAVLTQTKPSNSAAPALTRIPGLPNIGQTCFLNAMLSAVLSTQNLTVLNQRLQASSAQVTDPPAKAFLQALVNLIQHISQVGTAVTPRLMEPLVRAARAILPDKDHAQHDAAELFQLLMTRALPLVGPCPAFADLTLPDRLQGTAITQDGKLHMLMPQCDVSRQNNPFTLAELLQDVEFRCHPGRGCQFALSPMPCGPKIYQTFKGNPFQIEDEVTLNCAEPRHSQVRLRVVSVAVHNGRSCTHGHYFALNSTPSPNGQFTWRLHDDQSVTDYPGGPKKYFESHGGFASDWPDLILLEVV